jgi:hypothetical protein
MATASKDLCTTFPDGSKESKSPTADIPAARDFRTDSASFRLSLKPFESIAYQLLMPNSP